MRKVLFVTVAAILVGAPMTASVRADDSVTIKEQGNKDTVTIQDKDKKDKDSVTIKEREKTEGVNIKRDDDVVVKERQAPRKEKEDEKVIIKDK